jgi:hypothetical protein
MALTCLLKKYSLKTYLFEHNLRRRNGFAVSLEKNH